MNILVTGSKGQLGLEIQQIAPDYPGYNFFFTDIEELDITDRPLINEFFRINKPKIVINCAGYTAVDKAESEPEKAMMINGTAVGYLAEASANEGSFFIHISTDYVFDGSKNRPYREDDLASPASIYAQSKLEGEKETIHRAKNGMIIRTSWLYSEFMSNFVKTIIQKGKERGSLNVVYDQTGTPTWAADLAKIILLILPEAIKDEGVNIYNFSNEGVTSWYDFAKAIVEYSGINCRINPIQTEEYPTPAKRPFYTVLNKKKIRERFQIEIPHWNESLKKCINRMNYDK